MKTLLLLRHAKSSWDPPDLADHERILDERGRHAAELMAFHLSRHPQRPSLVLCSSARRAVETLAPLRRRLGARTRVRIERGLYLASAEVLEARLARLRASEACVLLIGHDPGLHELAVALAERGERAALARLREKFPTAALAVLSLEIERWRAITPGCGRLVAFETPRELV